MRGSSQKILDTKHLWKWHTLGPLLGLAFVVWFTIFDPFGFESIAKYQSEKVIYKIYSAAYPTEMRDDISVVLLDNETLRYFNERWPASFSTQANILRAILGYEPAAVFVDIFFDHVYPEDNFGGIEDAIRHYHNPSLPEEEEGAKEKAPVPLLVAWSQYVRPEIWDVVFDPKSRGQPVSADIKGDPSHPPLYPLNALNGHPEPAAVALYRLICDTPGSGDEGGLARIRDDASGCKKKYLIAPDSDREGHGSTSAMEVVWGLYPARHSCNRAENVNSVGPSPKCTDLYHDSHPDWRGRVAQLIWRMTQLLWENLIPARHRTSDPFRIYYHAEISARELFESENHQKDSELMSSLSGKINLRQ